LQSGTGQVYAAVSATNTTTPIRVPDGQFLSLETPSALTAFFWGWEKTMWLIKADFHLDRSAADEVIDGL
jgi:hypothetical protein